MRRSFVRTWRMTAVMLGVALMGLPILVFGALVLLQLGSIVAVPGLVISALPQTFSDQAATSIEQASTVFGPITTVKCPTPPATVMGQQFTCTLYRIGSGQTYHVSVTAGSMTWVYDVIVVSC